MQDLPNPTEILVSKAETYIKNAIQLLRLQLISKTTEIISNLFAKFIVLLFFIFFLTFFSIAVSIWIGEELGKNYLGFLVTSGFYGFVALILMVFKNKFIVIPISNSLIMKLLDNKNEKMII